MEYTVLKTCQCGEKVKFKIQSASVIKEVRTVCTSCNAKLKLSTESGTVEVE